MGVLIPIGFAEITWRWRVTNDPDEMVCTFGVNPAVGATADSLALDFDTYAKTVGTGFSAAAVMSNQYVMEPTVCRFRTSSLPPVTAEAGTALAGTVDLTELPNNVAILVQKRSASGGRQNRGRMYLPPYMFTSPAIDGAGNIAAANVTAFQAKITSLDSALTLDGHQGVILHSDPTAIPTVITSLVLSNRIATQRTRTRR